MTIREKIEWALVVVVAAWIVVIPYVI